MLPLLYLCEQEINQESEQQKDNTQRNGNVKITFAGFHNRGRGEHA